MLLLRITLVCATVMYQYKAVATICKKKLQCCNRKHKQQSSTLAVCTATATEINLTCETLHMAQQYQNLSQDAFI
jgi:hypothetical protein